MNKLNERFNNIINKKQYIVSYGNETDFDGTEIFYTEKEAKEFLDSLDHSDFDNPISVTNFASLDKRAFDKEKIKEKYSELVEDYGEIEDEGDYESIFDELEEELEYDPDSYINDGVDNLYYKNFGSINDSSDELLKETESNLGKDLEGKYDDYVVKHVGKGKYSSLVVEDKDGEEIKTIKLRIADHTYNPANNTSNERSGDFISVEISNKNATKDIFNTRYSLHFDSEDEYKSILESVKDRLNNII